MGKHGNVATPIKLLKERGTFRKDRHEAGVMVPAVAQVPRPPASLSARAKAEWRRIAARIHTLGILTELDYSALEAYAIIRARALECERELARDGLTIETPQGRKRHPALVSAERAWSDARKYELSFGLTPVARRGLRMSEKDPEEAAAGAKHARFFGGASRA